jgi:hypothetical protein
MRKIGVTGSPQMNKHFAKRVQSRTNSLLAGDMLTNKMHYTVVAGELLLTSTLMTASLVNRLIALP